MSDIRNLRGCGTALVTPFSCEGDIDENALRRLIDYQIEEGVDFLVACGTTGEGVTLTSDEQARVVFVTVEATEGRVPVLAGAGGYNTRSIKESIRRYTDLGANGILSVTPYYNKPTQEGLYKHFLSIAESSQLPIVLYNVPGRTACNLTPETVARLSFHTKIVGIKEASGDISQIGEVASLVDPSFRIFAGDDSLILPVAALGGVGVISVASNLVPHRVSQLVRACLEGRFGEAQTMHRELTPLFKAMFIESNPIPVKAALAMSGHIEEVYRLPLVPLAQHNKERLRQVLAEAKILPEPVTQNVIP